MKKIYLQSILVLNFILVLFYGLSSFSTESDDPNLYVRDGRYTTGGAYCFFNLVNANKNLIIIDIIVNQSCTEGGVYEFKRIGTDSYFRLDVESKVDRTLIDRCSVNGEIKEKSLLPCRDLDFIYVFDGKKFVLGAKIGDSILTARVKIKVIKESALYVLRNYKSLNRKGKTITETFDYKVLYTLN